jgi:hypothetical protein
VEGVKAVDIDSLHDSNSTSEPEEPEPIIPASAFEQDGVKIPSLLVINGQEIDVEKMPT